MTCSALPVPVSRLVDGCEVGQVDCGVAGHGRLIVVTVPPGMRWALPPGPVGLAVFFGEGRLRGPIGDRELVEDDLVLCRAAGPLAMEGSGEEELRAYLWAWEDDPDLPEYTDARSTCRTAGPLPAGTVPMAGSAVVDGGGGLVRIGDRTVEVTTGDVLHHGGTAVAAVDPAGLALIGVWSAGGRPVLARRLLHP